MRYTYLLTIDTPEKLSEENELDFMDNLNKYVYYNSAEIEYLGAKEIDDND